MFFFGIKKSKKLPALIPDVCDICIMAIEKCFAKSMSFEDIIDKFAAAKSRKHKL